MSFDPWCYQVVVAVLKNGVVLLATRAMFLTVHKKGTGVIVSDAVGNVSG
jgi:hypothetical protein